MAVFKRLLTASKNRIKSRGEKQEREPSILERLQEFERLKAQWKEELAGMSEFLIIKSTEEQKEEGAEEIVDTAYLVDRDGLPILRAVFGVQQFAPSEVKIEVDKELLTVIAEKLEDTECSVYKKRLIRKLDLPINVDNRRMFCEYTPSGVLLVEMPFHLLPRRFPSECPSQRTLVPIVLDELGRRVIRLKFDIGSDFTADDLSVDLLEGRLTVNAAYSAEIGLHGIQVTRREVKREFKLPPHRGADVDSFRHYLSSDGVVYIELILRTDDEFQCHITTEDLRPALPSLSSDVTDEDQEQDQEQDQDDDDDDEIEESRCSTSS